MRRINKYLPLSIQNYFYERKANLINTLEYREWEAKGCPVPPPHLAKQKKIEELATQYGCEVFIETGTYLGDTLYSQKGNFKKLISIELGRKLYLAATRRFRKYSNIEIHHGNSGDLLYSIMPGITSRALLWLDGHYSGGITAKGQTECPVFRELDSVFSNNALKHIIMIDDARLFIGKRDYPTMDELREYVRKKDPAYSIRVENDMIIITTQIKPLQGC